MKQDAQSEGAVRQAFRASLRQELADFYRLLATLETQAGNPIPDGHRSADSAPTYLTLRRLLVWLSDPLVRCQLYCCVRAPCPFWHLFVCRVTQTGTCYDTGSWNRRFELSLQVRLRWLASVADAVSSLSGGRLLAALESAAAHGQPLVRFASCCFEQKHSSAIP